MLVCVLDMASFVPLGEQQEDEEAQELKPIREKVLACAFTLINAHSYSPFTGAPRY